MGRARLPAAALPLLVLALLSAGCGGAAPYQAGASPTPAEEIEATYSRRTPFVPLDNPKTLPASNAAYLRPDDR